MRNCCQEHLGMPLNRYLTLRRMYLARRALEQADPAATRVTDVATEFGFWEFGRFAVTYKSAFGESPSTTLRKNYNSFPVIPCERPVATSTINWEQESHARPRDKAA
jgi:transcriptional regulator GlxA family with amidase domain